MSLKALTRRHQLFGCGDDSRLSTRRKEPLQISRCFQRISRFLDLIATDPAHVVLLNHESVYVPTSRLISHDQKIVICRDTISKFCAQYNITRALPCFVLHFMHRHRKFAQTALGILRIMGDCVVAPFWVGTDDDLLLLGFTLEDVSRIGSH